MLITAGARDFYLPRSVFKGALTHAFGVVNVLSRAFFSNMRAAVKWGRCRKDLYAVYSIDIEVDLEMSAVASLTLS